MRTACAALLGVGLLVGCSPAPQTSQEQVRHEAQRDAKELRHDLQDAGAEAQKAAEQFRSETKAAVAGAQQGWKEAGPTNVAVVDVNSASQAQLERLPGISASEAARIVRGRPYSDPGQLVERGLLGRAEYERLRDRLVAK